MEAVRLVAGDPLPGTPDLDGAQADALKKTDARQPKIAMQNAEIRAKLAQAQQGEAEAGLRGAQTEEARAGIPLAQAQAAEGVRQIGLGPVGAAKEQAQAAIGGYGEALALLEKTVEPEVDALLRQVPPEQRTPELLPIVRMGLQDKVMRNELSGPRYFAIMSLLEKKVQQSALPIV